MRQDNSHQIRSYTRRSGRITEAQQRAINLYSHRYTLSSDNFDWKASFCREAPRYVEIGFGMGDTLLEFARQSPTADFLGIDVYQPGIGRLYNQLDKYNIKNVRVIVDDAVLVFEHLIQSASLDGIYIFFPDPWPKKRHHKRRLIQTSFALQLSQALKVGGIIHLATDWQSYAAQILEVMSNTIGLANVNSENDLSAPYNVRSETKFEHRGLKLGHDVFDYLFKRV